VGGLENKISLQVTGNLASETSASRRHPPPRSRCSSENRGGSTTVVEHEGRSSDAPLFAVFERSLLSFGFSRTKISPNWQVSLLNADWAHASSHHQKEVQQWLMGLMPLAPREVRFIRKRICVLRVRRVVVNRNPNRVLPHRRKGGDAPPVRGRYGCGRRSVNAVLWEITMHSGVCERSVRCSLSNLAVRIEDNALPPIGR
jgi:hypothetical protein